MKVKKFLTGKSKGQGVIEYILLIGAVVVAMVVMFGVYSRITSSGGDKLESSTNTVSDQLSTAIQDAAKDMGTPEKVEWIEVEEEEVKPLNSVYSKEGITQDNCVKVDISGSAVAKFTIPYEQTVKIHRPSMHLKMSNFCDISVETVTLALDGRKYWHFKKSFFDYIKEWIKRIIGRGKLRNYRHHFYYRNIERKLGPGQHQLTFRWTGTAYAKSNSVYSGEIKATLTSKTKRRIKKHSIDD